jgi:cAMP-specific phosphodiesterase 4
MKTNQYTEVRKAIIEMVLTTDLSAHLQLVGSLKTALLSQNKNSIMDSPMMIMKIIIKCADIGHSTKCTKIHAKWSELIIEEFFLQGDEEKELGMEISPFMNRASENSAKNQVGFFEFIVLPFYDAVAEVFSLPGFTAIQGQARVNYNLWKKAEAMQLKSIKDILDQVFSVEDDQQLVSSTRISLEQHHKTNKLPNS